MDVYHSSADGRNQGLSRTQDRTQGVGLLGQVGRFGDVESLEHKANPDDLG